MAAAPPPAPTSEPTTAVQKPEYQALEYALAHPPEIVSGSHRKYVIAHEDRNPYFYARYHRLELTEGFEAAEQMPRPFELTLHAHRDGLEFRATDVATGIVFHHFHARCGFSHHIFAMMVQYPLIVLGVEYEVPTGEHGSLVTWLALYLMELSETDPPTNLTLLSVTDSMEDLGILEAISTRNCMIFQVHKTLSRLWMVEEGVIGYLEHPRWITFARGQQTGEWRSKPTPEPITRNLRQVSFADDMMFSNASPWTPDQFFVLCRHVSGLETMLNLSDLLKNHRILFPRKRDVAYVRILSAFRGHVLVLFMHREEKIALFVSLAIPRLYSIQGSTAAVVTQFTAMASDKSEWKFDDPSRDYPQVNENGELLICLPPNGHPHLCDRTGHLHKLNVPINLEGRVSRRLQENMLLERYEVPRFTGSKYYLMVTHMYEVTVAWPHGYSEIPPVSTPNGITVRYEGCVKLTIVASDRAIGVPPETYQIDRLPPVFRQKLSMSVVPLGREIKSIEERSRVLSEEQIREEFAVIPSISGYSTLSEESSSEEEEEEDEPAADVGTPPRRLSIGGGQQQEQVEEDVEMFDTSGKPWQAEPSDTPLTPGEAASRQQLVDYLTQNFPVVQERQAAAMMSNVLPETAFKKLEDLGAFSQPDVYVGMIVYRDTEGALVVDARECDPKRKAETPTENPPPSLFLRIIPPPRTKETPWESVIEPRWEHYPLVLFSMRVGDKWDAGVYLLDLRQDTRRLTLLYIMHSEPRPGLFKAMRKTRNWLVCPLWDVELHLHGSQGLVAFKDFVTVEFKNIAPEAGSIERTWRATLSGLLPKMVDLRPSFEDSVLLHQYRTDDGQHGLRAFSRNGHVWNCNLDLIVSEVFPNLPPKRVILLKLAANGHAVFAVTREWDSTPEFLFLRNPEAYFVISLRSWLSTNDPIRAVRAKAFFKWEAHGMSGHVGEPHAVNAIGEVLFKRRMEQKPSAFLLQSGHLFLSRFYPTTRFPKLSGQYITLAVTSHSQWGFIFYAREIAYPVSSGTDHPTRDKDGYTIVYADALNETEGFSGWFPLFREVKYSSIRVYCVPWTLRVQPRQETIHVVEQSVSTSGHPTVTGGEGEPTKEGEKREGGEKEGKPKLVTPPQKEQEGQRKEPETPTKRKPRGGAERREELQASKKRSPKVLWTNAGEVRRSLSPSPPTRKKFLPFEVPTLTKEDYPVMKWESSTEMGGDTFSASDDLRLFWKGSAASMLMGTPPILRETRKLPVITLIYKLTKTELKLGIRDLRPNSPAERVFTITIPTGETNPKYKEPRIDVLAHRYPLLVFQVNAMWELPYSTIYLVDFRDGDKAAPIPLWTGKVLDASYRNLHVMKDWIVCSLSNCKIERRFVDVEHSVSDLDRHERLIEFFRNSEGAWVASGVDYWEYDISTCAESFTDNVLFDYREIRRSGDRNSDFTFSVHTQNGDVMVVSIEELLCLQQLDEVVPGVIQLLEGDNGYAVLSIVARDQSANVVFVISLADWTKTRSAPRAVVSRLYVTAGGRVGPVASGTRTDVTSEGVVLLTLEDVPKSQTSGVESPSPLDRRPYLLYPGGYLARLEPPASSPADWTFPADLRLCGDCLAEVRCDPPSTWTYRLWNVENKVPRGGIPPFGVDADDRTYLHEKLVFMTEYKTIRLPAQLTCEECAGKCEPGFREMSVPPESMTAYFDEDVFEGFEHTSGKTVTTAAGGEGRGEQAQLPVQPAPTRTPERPGWIRAVREVFPKVEDRVSASAMIQLMEKMGGSEDVLQKIGEKLLTKRPLVVEVEEPSDLSIVVKVWDILSNQVIREVRLSHPRTIIRTVVRVHFPLVLFEIQFDYRKAPHYVFVLDLEEDSAHLLSALCRFDGSWRDPVYSIAVARKWIHLEVSVMGEILTINDQTGIWEPCPTVMVAGEPQSNYSIDSVKGKDSVWRSTTAATERLLRTNFSFEDSVYAWNLQTEEGSYLGLRNLAKTLLWSHLDPLFRRLPGFIPGWRVKSSKILAVQNGYVVLHSMIRTPPLHPDDLPVDVQVLLLLKISDWIRAGNLETVPFRSVTGLMSDIDPANVAKSQGGRGSALRGSVNVQVTTEGDLYTSWWWNRPLTESERAEGGEVGYVMVLETYLWKSDNSVHSIYLLEGIPDADQPAELTELHLDDATLCGSYLVTKQFPGGELGTCFRAFEFAAKEKGAYEKLLPNTKTRVIHKGFALRRVSEHCTKTATCSPGEFAWMRQPPSRVYKMQIGTDVEHQVVSEEELQHTAVRTVGGVPIPEPDPTARRRQMIESLRVLFPTVEERKFAAELALVFEERGVSPEIALQPALVAQPSSKPILVMFSVVNPIQVEVQVRDAVGMNMLRHLLLHHRRDQEVQMIDIRFPIIVFKARYVSVTAVETPFYVYLLDLVNKEHPVTLLAKLRKDVPSDARDWVITARWVFFRARGVEILTGREPDLKWERSPEAGEVAPVIERLRSYKETMDIPPTCSVSCAKQDDGAWITELRPGQEYTQIIYSIQDSVCFDLRSVTTGDPPHQEDHIFVIDSVGRVKDMGNVLEVFETLPKHEVLSGNVIPDIVCADNGHLCLGFVDTVTKKTLVVLLSLWKWKQTNSLVKSVVFSCVNLFDSARLLTAPVLPEETAELRLQISRGGEFYTSWTTDAGVRHAYYCVPPNKIYSVSTVGDRPWTSRRLRGSYFVRFDAMEDEESLAVHVYRIRPRPITDERRELTQALPDSSVLVLLDGLDLHLESTYAMPMNTLTWHSTGEVPAILSGELGGRTEEGGGVTASVYEGVLRLFDPTEGKPACVPSLKNVSSVSKQHLQGDPQVTSTEHRPIVRILRRAEMDIGIRRVEESVYGENLAAMVAITEIPASNKVVVQLKNAVTGASLYEVTLSRSKLVTYPQVGWPFTILWLAIDPEGSPPRYKDGYRRKCLLVDLEQPDSPPIHLCDEKKDDECNFLLSKDCVYALMHVETRYYDLYTGVRRTAHSPDQWVQFRKHGIAWETLEGFANLNAVSSRLVSSDPTIGLFCWIDKYEDGVPRLNIRATDGGETDTSVRRLLTRALSGLGPFGQQLRLCLGSDSERGNLPKPYLQILTVKNGCAVLYLTLDGKRQFAFNLSLMRWAVMDDPSEALITWADFVTAAPALDPNREGTMADSFNFVVAASSEGPMIIRTKNAAVYVDEANRVFDLIRPLKKRGLIKFADPNDSWRPALCYNAMIWTHWLPGGKCHSCLLRPVVDADGRSLDFEILRNVQPEPYQHFWIGEVSLVHVLRYVTEEGGLAEFSSTNCLLGIFAVGALAVAAVAVTAPCPDVVVVHHVYEKNSGEKGVQMCICCTTSPARIECPRCHRKLYCCQTCRAAEWPHHPCESQEVPKKEVAGEEKEKGKELQPQPKQLQEQQQTK